MNLELSQMLRFERWLQANPVKAIQDALDRDASPEGQARLAKYIVFKMARDVKNAANQIGKDISWRDARKIVRRALSEQRAA